MSSNWWGNNIPRRTKKTRTLTDEWHNRWCDEHSQNFKSSGPRRTTMDKRSKPTQSDSTLSKSKSQRDKDGTKESFQSTQNDSTASSGKSKRDEMNKSSKSTQNDSTLPKSKLKRDKHSTVSQSSWSNFSRQFRGNTHSSFAKCPSELRGTVSSRHNNNMSNSNKRRISPLCQQDQDNISRSRKRQWDQDNSDLDNSSSSRHSYPSCQFDNHNNSISTVGNSLTYEN